jgi:hypothetical protein
MATARLGHADLLLRDHDAAWRAIDLMDSRRYRDARRAALRLTRIGNCRPGGPF